MAIKDEDFDNSPDVVIKQDAPVVEEVVDLKTDSAQTTEQTAETKAETLQQSVKKENKADNTVVDAHNTKLPDVFNIKDISYEMLEQFKALEIQRKEMSFIKDKFLYKNGSHLAKAVTYDDDGVLYRLLSKRCDRLGYTADKKEAYLESYLDFMRTDNSIAYKHRWQADINTGAYQKIRETVPFVNDESQSYILMGKAGIVSPAEQKIIDVFQEFKNMSARNENKATNFEILLNKLRALEPATGEPKPGESGSLNWLSWKEKAAIRSRLLREMDSASLDLTESQQRKIQSLLTDKEYIMGAFTLNPFNQRVFDIMYDIQTNNSANFQTKLEHVGFPSWVKQTLAVAALVGVGLYLATTLDFAGSSFLASQAIAQTMLGSVGSYAITAVGLNVLESVTQVALKVWFSTKNLFSMGKEELKDAGMGEVAKSLDKIQARLEVLNPHSYEAQELSKIPTLKDVKEIKNELKKINVDGLALGSLEYIKEQFKDSIRANPQNYNLQQALTPSKLITLHQALSDHLLTLPEVQRHESLNDIVLSIAKDLKENEKIDFNLTSLGTTLMSLRDDIDNKFQQQQSHSSPKMR